MCVDYGAGNLKSIVNGFKKIGVRLEVADNPSRFGDAEGIILPGVGSFGNAMEKIMRFAPIIKEKVDEGTPFLGVCLGAQVIFDASDESPGVKGLGLLTGSCKRFGSGLKVPHMGWNRVGKKTDTPLLEGIEDGQYYYFVHSYYVKPGSKDVVSGQTEYGITFPSVISADNINATQFHPEKSGENGLKILKNFAGMCKR
ncbi:imidazole glycerol phosphate synthase subunit HisH [Candidatus Altiarchaeota archaeon]